MKFQRFGAGVLLFFTLLGVGSLLTQHAFALLPGGGGSGPYDATAVVIDQNHISVTVTGTYDSGSGTVDMSTASGVYYSGRVAPGEDGQDTKYIQGGPKKVGLDDTNCQSYFTTDVSGQANSSNLPYTDTLSITLHFMVDPAGTTSNNCIQPPDYSLAADNSRFSIPNLTSIGAPASYAGDNYGWIVGTDSSKNPIKGGPFFPSEAIFFRANDSQILSTQGDPAFDNVAPYAEFDEIGSSSQFKLTKGASVETIDANCPDYIQLSSSDPVSSDGSTQAVTYVTQTGDGSQGNPCKPDTTNSWRVLMLINTPSNTAAGTTNANGGTETGTPPAGPACPITTWGLDWLACPIIEGVQQTMDTISTIITDWLVTDIDGTFDFQKSSNADAAAYHDAWNSFRTLAISFIILAGLVMVISEAFGFEAVSAYTIRKVLPRLVIFAILIEISWPGMQFIAQFSNDIAAWIGDMIIYPFHSLNPAGETVGGMLASWGAVLGGAVILGPAGILSFLATLAITMLVLFLTLLLRYAALIATIVIMPVALAGMILPGTRRYARIVIDEYIAVQILIPVLFAAGLALGVVMNIIISSLTQTPPSS